MGIKSGPALFCQFCRKHPLEFIILLGTLLRLPFIFFSPVHGDEGMYMYDAQLIIKGATPFSDFHTRAPIFIYSLASFMWLFGEDVVVARFFSLTLFILTSLVISRLGTELHSRRVGLLAAGVFSLSPFSFTWGIVVETEVYLIFFLSLAALFLLRGLREETTANRSKSPATFLFLSGLLLGVAVFTRRTGIILLPTFLFFLYLRDILHMSGSKNGGKASGRFLPSATSLVAGFSLSFLSFSFFIISITDTGYFTETFVSSAGVGGSGGNRIPILQGLVEHAWYLLFPVLVYAHTQLRSFLPPEFRKMADIFTFLVLALIITVYTYVPYIFLLPILGYFLYLIGGVQWNRGRDGKESPLNRGLSGPDDIMLVGAFTLLGILTISSIDETVFFHYLLVLLSMGGLGVLYLLLKHYSPSRRHAFKWLCFIALLFFFSFLASVNETFRFNVFSVIGLLSLLLFTLLVLEGNSREKLAFRMEKASIFPLVWLAAVGSFYLTYNMLGEIYLYELMPPVSILVALFLNTMLEAHLEPEPEPSLELQNLSFRQHGHYSIPSMVILMLLFSAFLSGMIYANQELHSDGSRWQQEPTHIPDPWTIRDVAVYIEDHTSEDEEILTANMAIAVEANRNIIMNLSHPSIYSSVYQKGFAALDTIDYPSLSDIMEYMNETRTRYLVYDLFLYQYYIKFNPVFKEYVFSHYHLEKCIDNVDIYVRSNHDIVDRLSLNSEAAGQETLATTVFSGGPQGVVWEQLENGKSEIIYSWLTRKGKDYRVHAATPKRSSESYSPFAAMDSGGQMHLVWEERFPDYSFLNYAVVKGTKKTIVPLGSKFDTSVFARNPTLVVDQEDRAHIVWTENRQDTFALYYTRLEANGSRSFQDHELLKGPGDIRFPSMAVGPDGRLHLAFEDGRSGSYQVYYMVMNGTTPDASSLVETAPEQISLDYKGIHPDLAVDPAGGVHVAWEGFNVQNHQYIHYFFQKDGVRLELNITDPERNTRDETEEENYQDVGGPELAVTGGEVALAFMLQGAEDVRNSVFLTRFSLVGGVPNFKDFVFPSSLRQVSHENYDVYSLDMTASSDGKLGLAYSAESRECKSIFFEYL